jgi:hypothetical protein
MSAQHNGGPAFPVTEWHDGGSIPIAAKGMSLRDWFAAMAPKPPRWRIKLESNMDRSRNPHNDSYKPKIRGEFEIEADLRFEFADAMLKAREA